MMDNGRQRRTRRTVLGAAGSVAVAGLAGCVSGDDSENDTGNESGDDGGNETASDDGSGDDTSESTATVTLLAESTSPHDEGLPDDNISHACEHFEFGDSEEIEGATTADGAPEISATHQLFEITVEGESGYIVFHGGEEGEDSHDHGGEEGEDGHDHGGEEGEDSHDHGGEEGEDSHDHGGGAYAFFVDGGSAAVTGGNTVYQQGSGVSACGPADMYVIAEPDENEILLKISP